MADNAKPTVPPGPWTLEKLGRETYEALHRAYYGGPPDWQCPYDLDLTPIYQAQQQAADNTAKRQPIGPGGGPDITKE